MTATATAPRLGATPEREEEPDDLGPTTSTFTHVHVLLSLVGIGSGLIVMVALLARRPREGWTAVFLATTVATSVTGFGFPFDHLLPSHEVGIVSLAVLAVLAVAVAARYRGHLAGRWRLSYVVGAAAVRDHAARRLLALPGAHRRRREAVPPRVRTRRPALGRRRG